MNKKFYSSRIISFLLVFLISFGQITPVFASDRKENLNTNELEEAEDKKIGSDLVEYTVKFIDGKGVKLRENYIGEAIRGTRLSTLDKKTGELKKEPIILDEDKNIVEFLVKDKKQVEKLDKNFIMIDYLSSENYVFNRYKIEYLSILDYKVPFKSYPQYKLDKKQGDIEKINDSYYKSLVKSKEVLDFKYLDRDILILENNIDLKLKKGVRNLNLPKDILVKEGNGSSRLKVSWDVSKIDTDKLGEYKLEGKLLDNNNQEIKEDYEVPKMDLKITDGLNKDFEIRGHKNTASGLYRSFHFYMDPNNANKRILIDEFGIPGLEENDIEPYSVEVGEYTEKALNYNWLVVKGEKTQTKLIEKDKITDFEFEYEPVYRVVLKEILRVDDSKFKLDKRLNPLKDYYGINGQSVEIHRAAHLGFTIENRPEKNEYKVKANDQGKYFGANGNPVVGEIEGFSPEKYEDDIVIFYIFNEDLRGYDVIYVDENDNELEVKKGKETQVGQKAEELAEDEITSKEGKKYILNDFNKKSIIISRDDEENKIIFKYKEKVSDDKDTRVNYSIRHVDEDANDIISPVILEGQVGDIVIGGGEFDWKENGYDFIGVEPKDGVLELEKESKNQIIYSYKKFDKDKEEPEDPNPEKIFAEYRVSYVDTEGKLLLPERRELGRIGTSINLNGNQKELEGKYIIEGYRLNGGSLEEKDICKLEIKDAINQVSFVYRRATTEYKIELLDEDGNIIRENIETGSVGEDKKVVISKEDEFIEKDGQVYILNDLNEKSKILGKDLKDNIFKFRYKKATKEDKMGNYLIKYVYKDRDENLVNIISPFVLEGRVGYKVSVEDEKGNIDGIIDFRKSGYKFKEVKPSQIDIEKREGKTHVNEIIYYYDLMDENHPEYPEGGIESPKDPQDFDNPSNQDDKVFVEYTISHIDKKNKDKHLVDYSPKSYIGKENTSIIASDAEEDIKESGYGIDEEKNRTKKIFLERNKPIEESFEYVKKDRKYIVKFIDEDGKELKKDIERNGYEGETVKYIADNIIEIDGVEYILLGKNESRLTLLGDESKNIIKYMYKKALTEENIKNKEGKYLVRHVYEYDGAYVDIINPIEFTDKLMTIVEGRNENQLKFDDFTFINKIIPKSIVVSEKVKEIKFVYQPNNQENPPMGPEEDDKKQVDYFVKYTVDGKSILDDENYKVDRDMTITREGPKYIIGKDGLKYELVSDAKITRLIEKTGEIFEFKYRLFEDSTEARIGYYKLKHIDEDTGKILSESGLIEGKHGDIIEGPGPKDFKGYDHSRVSPIDGKISLEEGLVKEIVYFYKDDGTGEGPEEPGEDRKTKYSIIYEDEKGNILKETTNDGIVGTKLTTIGDSYIIVDGKLYILNDSPSKTIELKESGNKIIFKYKEGQSLDKDKAYYRIRYINERGQDLIEANIQIGLDRSIVQGEEKKFTGYELVRISPKDGKVSLENGKIKEIVFSYKWIGSGEEPETPKPPTEELRNYIVNYEYYKDDKKVGTETETYKGILGSKISVVVDSTREYSDEIYRVEGSNIKVIEIRQTGNNISFKYKITDLAEDEGSYIVRHVNEDGIDIIKSQYLSGKIGTIVEASEKTIKGYRFLRVVPEDKKISIGKDIREIVFTYEWIGEGEEPKDPEDEKYRSYRVTYKSEAGLVLKPEYNSNAILGSKLTEYAEEILVKDDRIYKIIGDTFLTKKIVETGNNFDFIYKDITDEVEEGMGYYKIIHEEENGRLILDSGLLSGKIGSNVRGNILDESSGYKYLRSIPENGSIEIEANKINIVRYLYEKIDDKPELPENKKTDYTISYVNKDKQDILAKVKSSGIIASYITAHADYRVKGIDGKTYVLNDSNRKTIKLEETGSHIVFNYILETDIDRDLGYYRISHVYENGIEIKISKILSEEHGTIVRDSPLADKTLIRIEPEVGYIVVDREDYKELIYVYKYDGEEPGTGGDLLREYNIRYVDENNKTLKRIGPVEAIVGSKITREAPAFLEDGKYKLDDAKTKSLLVKGINKDLVFKYRLDEDYEKNKGKAKYIVRYINERGEDIAKSVVEYGQVGTSIIADRAMDIKDYVFTGNTIPEEGSIVLDKDIIREIKYIYKWNGSGEEPDIPNIEDPESKNKTKYKIEYLDSSNNSISPSETYRGVIGTKVKAEAKSISGYSLTSDRTIIRELLEKEEENILIFKYKKDGGGTIPDPGPDPWPDPGPGPNPPIDPNLPIKPQEPEAPDIDDGMLNKEDHFAYIQGYPDDTVKPEGYLTREEAAAVFFRLLKLEDRNKIDTKNHNFKDLPKGRWSEREIATLVNGGILTGYPDGTFKQSNRITRAELAKIIVEFDELLDYDDNLFIDIDGHWAEDYINSAAKNKWIEGYPTGEFKPENFITRAEFVTMVNRVLERVTRVENMLGNRLEFKDLQKNKWYYEAMQEAINSHDYERDKNGVERWTKLTGVF